MQRTRRWRGLWAAGGCCLVLATGCSGGSRSGVRPGVISVADDAGRTVTLTRPAGRVLCLIPSLTQVIVALGAEDRLVARTRWDVEPRLAGLPVVDNALVPSVEWIVARRPDLVIAWPDQPGRAVVSRLTDVGIPVYAAAVETLPELFATVVRIGELLGRKGAADSLEATLRAGLDSVRRAVLDLPRPTVFYAIGLNPPMAAGPGTYINELIEVAGGRNVFGDLHPGWPQISLEELVRRRPDVIIVSEPDTTAGSPLTALRSRAVWSTMPAVRHGRVYGVPADQFDRPGPRVVDAARALAELLHGSVRQTGRQ